MQYAEVEVGQLDNLMRDDTVVFEQKFDGTRVLAVVEYGKPVRFLQRGGKVLTHTAATQHLDGLRPTLEAMVGGPSGEVVLDGELMIHTGEYHLFDVPYARLVGIELIKPDMTYYQRRSWLRASGLREWIDGTPISVTYQATTPREKSRLLEAVREAGGEGVMAKSLYHPYLPGKRTKEAVKLKFVKTADVVVTAVDRPDAKHGSFKLGAYPSMKHATSSIGELIDVGGASAIGKDESIEVGDVVEVAYLYWTGHSLYQPRVIKKRTDKGATECTLDQFPAYSRTTINLSPEGSD